MFAVKYSEFRRKREYVHQSPEDAVALKRVREARAVARRLFDCIPSWFWICLFKDVLGLLEYPALLFGVQEVDNSLVIPIIIEPLL